MHLYNVSHLLILTRYSSFEASVKVGMKIVGMATLRRRDLRATERIKDAGAFLEHNY